MLSASIANIQLVVDELMLSQTEYITREKTRLAKTELDKAAMSPGDMLMESNIPLPLVAKARTLLARCRRRL